MNGARQGNVVAHARPVLFRGGRAGRAFSAILVRFSFWDYSLVPFFSFQPASKMGDMH